MLTHSPIWKALQQEKEKLSKQKLTDLFANDPARFNKLSFEINGILVDFSKNSIDSQTMRLLLQLATEKNMKRKIEQLFHGEKVNVTEGRAAHHVALRDTNTTNADVVKTLNKIKQFADAVHGEEYLGYSGKRITHVVNVGVGGSDLGPEFVTQALFSCRNAMKLEFVSSIDGEQTAQLLKCLNPETTLVIVVSKSFTTLDTLTNARTLKAWFIDKVPDKKAFAKHFVGVSANLSAMHEFGISQQNMFPLWEWVGGRYSLWSAVGLSIALAIGSANFQSLLDGAYLADQHFYSTPFEKNIPMLMGLLAVWYINFFNVQSHIILPYETHLRRFPAYLQQLEMESLGKRTTLNGQTVDYATGVVRWGEVGSNGQHSFYQLLHQGMQFIPVDFIVPMITSSDLTGHRNLALADALAQAHALMAGEVPENVSENLQPHCICPGGKPSTMFLFERVTPSILGTLIALYEHKVFVQSVIWDVNAFDQWGVELGKKLARRILPLLSNVNAIDAYDASTQGLLHFVRKKQS